MSGRSRNSWFKAIASADDGAAQHTTAGSIDYPTCRLNITRAQGIAQFIHHASWLLVPLLIDCKTLAASLVSSGSATPPSRAPSSVIVLPSSPKTIFRASTSKNMRNYYYGSEESLSRTVAAFSDIERTAGRRRLFSAWRRMFPENDSTGVC